MANERAEWKQSDGGDGWFIDPTDFDRVDVCTRLLVDGERVRIRVHNTDDGCAAFLTADQWRAMCALPVVPAETPAIADGTSQPWTPPAKKVWTEAEVVEVLREPKPNRLVAAFVAAGASEEQAKRATDAYRRAPTDGLYAAWSDNGGNGIYRAEVDAVLAVLNAGAETPAESGGILAHWPKYQMSAAELRAQRDALTERVAELEAEVGRLTRERADRRFELVKAALASGRDGFTAVRDADEALGAMGGTKGGEP